MSEKKDLSGIMMTFLFMIVGLALTPTVQEQVTNVTGVGGNNLTGADWRWETISERIPRYRRVDPSFLGDLDHRNRTRFDCGLVEKLGGFSI